MPTKIRLQRRGKKGQPFYHIVIADGRAPRDGRFIEKIGTYNPLTKPASIEIDFEKALYWLKSGAQPTDTAKAILSYKGVLFKNHLLKGVQKGALTEEQAEEKFQTWLKDKEASILQRVKQEELDKKNRKKKILEDEMKVNEAIAARVAAKRAAKLASEHGEEPAEVVEPAEAEVTVPTEAAAETPVAEETAEIPETPVEEVAEVPETPAEEAAEIPETPAEEVAEVPESPVEEVPAVEEPVAAEPVAEETPAEEPADEAPASDEPTEEKAG